MDPSLLELQAQTCVAYGVAFDPPTPGTKVGVALQTLHRLPVHGLRLPPTATTCGWYIFAGDDWSDAEHFYQPMCVEHLADRCAFTLPYLALPPGWRFMVDGLGFVDVWRDDSLTLNGRDSTEPGTRA